MTKHETDPTCGKGAVTTRTPLPRVDFSKIAMPRDGIDSPRARSLTRKAIGVQPSGSLNPPSASATAASRTMLACSSPAAAPRSAALACGQAAPALDVVLREAPEADVLVAISHEVEPADPRGGPQVPGGDVADHERTRARSRRRSTTWWS